MNRSWLIAGTVALFSSLLLFLVFGFYNYFRDTQFLQTELGAKTQQVARRVSGELLIAPRGAPEAVSMQLAKELNLSEVKYGTKEELLNAAKKDDLLYAEIPIPFLEKQYVLRAAVPKISKLQYFNFSILLASILLIGFIVSIGLILQAKYLRRHVIKPIESLVETSTGDKTICNHWPQELQDISQKLNNSFQEREQAVYSQISRGVIHDLKTLLQSLKVATDLAKESPSDKRLANLLKVSEEKLPSLLGLIDTTLDGSRNISINPKKSPLFETIYKSIKTVKDLPAIGALRIYFNEPNEDLQIAHDPVQLERVFTNILKNGLEAAHLKNTEQGKVKVSFNLSDHDFIGVVIEDSGEGLPKTPESVFRLLKSSKPHGSGLGLLVSRKIVEAHKGHLIAGRSHELSGAKFEIKLPRGAQ